MQQQQQQQYDYLYKAVKENNVMEVQLYCSYKTTNLNWVNVAENGSTSLSLACSKGNLQIVKLLVEKGANMHLLGKPFFIICTRITLLTPNQCIFYMVICRCKRLYSYS
jgi:hypothetical protein